MDLFSRPDWVKTIEQGKTEIARGVKGKPSMRWKIEVKPTAEKYYLRLGKQNLNGEY